MGRLPAKTARDLRRLPDETISILLMMGVSGPIVVYGPFWLIVLILLIVIGISPFGLNFLWRRIRWAIRKDLRFY